MSKVETDFFKIVLSTWGENCKRILPSMH